MRAGMRRGEFLDLGGRAAGLEGPHHLVIERDRARLVVDARRLLGHRHAQPVPHQQRRHGGADGTVADDQGVIGERFRHAAKCEGGRIAAGELRMVASATHIR